MRQGASEIPLWCIYKAKLLWFTVFTALIHRHQQLRCIQRWRKGSIARSLNCNSPSIWNTKFSWTSQNHKLQLLLCLWTKFIVINTISDAYHVLRSTGSCEYYYHIFFFVFQRDYHTNIDIHSEHTDISALVIVLTLKFALFFLSRMSNVNINRQNSAIGRPYTLLNELISSQFNAQRQNSLP